MGWALSVQVARTPGRRSGAAGRHVGRARLRCRGQDEGQQRPPDAPALLGGQHVELGQEPDVLALQTDAEADDPVPVALDRSRLTATR